VSGNAVVLVTDQIIFTECDYGSAGEHIQYCLIGLSDSADTEWLFTPCRSSNKKRMVLSGLADRAFSECIGRSDLDCLAMLWDRLDNVQILFIFH